MPVTDKFGWTVPTVGAHKNMWGQILNDMVDDMDQNIQRVTTIGETAPSSPSEGDLWVDKTGGGKVLKVYRDSSWETISAGTGANELSELTDVGDSTPTDGNILSADGVDFDSKTPDSAGIVTKSGEQIINGVKTFGDFPVTPCSAPMTDYQAANKKYVDDNAGAFDEYTGSKNNMDQDEVITISHPSETGYDARIATFVREVLGEESNWSSIDFDTADEASYQQGDIKGTAVNFQVDTANTSGHFEDSGNSPVTIGPGNTEERIVEGVRFKLTGDDTIYEIISITGDGDGNDGVEFTKQDGDPATKAAGTYAVNYIYGTEFSGGVVKLNESGGLGFWETDYDPALDSDNTAKEYRDMRCEILAGNITTGNRIRITFTANSTLDTSLDNVSIVEQDSGIDGVTTPTEILFSGGSGCTITGGGSATSDELEFETDVSKAYLIHMALSSVNGNVRQNTSLGTTQITYYKDSADANDYAAAVLSSSGYGTFEGDNDIVLIDKIETRLFNQVYPVDQFYIVATTDSNQADCTDWEEINSAAITDTENGESIYYAFSFDGRTTWGIWDDTAEDVGWRPIARNNGGTWQFNSNATPGANYVMWTDAATAGENTHESALEQAFQVSANRMDGSDTGNGVEAIADAEWDNTDGAMDGWSTDATSVNVAIGLKSSTASVTPTIDQITLTYQAPTKWEPIAPNDDWQIEYHDTKTKLIKLGTGTESVVKGRVRIPK